MIQFKPVILTLGLLLLILQNSSSQRLGALPPDISWCQINLPISRIIFPCGLDSLAQEVAANLELQHQEERHSIGDQAKKINIVLQNQTTNANGFVGLAPWRSYFFTTPPPTQFELGSMSWTDLLSLHEYRHVQQISTTRHDVTRLAYYLFGELAWSGMVGLAIPDWFTEGDAVWAESVYTRQGRGRMPLFLQGYRSILLEEEIPAYSVARNRSLKRFIPDHYRLGYLMIKYGYENYGEEFWPAVFKQASAYDGLFYPFSRALKRNSGLGVSAFYKAAMEDFQNSLPLQESLPVPLISPDDQEEYTDYLHPQPGVDGSLYYLKRSYDSYKTIYNWQEGKEVIVVTPGASRETRFDMDKDLMVWSELRPHPRWSGVDYSNVVLHSLEGRYTETITNRGKYFSPAVHAGNQKIAVIHQGRDLQNELHILDLQGEVVKNFQGENGVAIGNPEWLNDSVVVATIRTPEGQMGISTFHLPTDIQEVIIELQDWIIGIPFIRDKEMFFAATGSRNERIYSYHFESGDLQPLTNTFNGAFQPSSTVDSLYYTSFTAKGYRIYSQPLSIKQEFGEQRAADGLPSLNILRSSEHSGDFSIKKYSKLSHLFNVHSWGFDYEEPNIIYGITSTNILHTLSARLGVEYDTDEEEIFPFVEFSTLLWYPVLDFQISHRNREINTQNGLVGFNQTELSSGLSLPLDFSSGIYDRQLLGFANYDLIFLSGEEIEDVDIPSIHTGLLLRQSKLKARLHLFPHFGFYLNMQYKNSLNELDAAQLTLKTALSLRGLTRTHNLILHADYLDESVENNYRFSNAFSYIRGGGEEPFSDYIYKGSANYHLPLLYPDWGFGGLIYFFRIRTNLFYDAAYYSIEGDDSFEYSTGAELIFDMNIFNDFYFSAGLRWSYLPKEEEQVFDFFLPVYRF